MAQTVEDLLASFPPVEVPAAVVALVEGFRKDIDRYKSKDFKELPLRGEFLNPLFEALGWDPSNKTAKSYADREVIQEDALQIGGYAKAPDYAFLIDGRRKFFVEAKRPSVNIEVDRAPAYQIRRYCWSAALPFGLVTDFEEFAIYDCRAIPSPTDSTKVGRIAYFRFDELDENWRILAGLFGRDAVVGGALETFAAETKAPKNTRPIDAEFLVEIRRWREQLAGDVAKRNESIDVLQLNAVVQTLIDRLVFLRIAEARGLEAYETLRQTVDVKADVYPQLVALFKRADDRYNSGLFHSQDIKQHESLKISDTLLKQIVGRLYYPEPYEFGVLPADILGRIYEQFLGEVITLDAKHHATVDLKPEVRKSGGVYYTPAPIVDYIVRSTVGPMLQGSTTPADVAKLSVVDPSCGSGSFLITAFQYLIDWHTDYYAARPNLAKKFLETGADGLLRLGTSERKRILLSNIYGVDIDPQAVEVAKLSLLLKVIEGQQQMELEVGRLLPDLDANIVCGNSLIGTDFPMPFEFTEMEALQINPFDWEVAFPGVFKGGGFSAVIGNPPYLNIDNVWGSKDARLAYVKGRYAPVYADKTDILFYFFKKAVEICPGEIGFIVSRSFLEADKAQKLRGWLASNARVREVLDFRQAVVFPKVGINTAIVRLTQSTVVKTSRFGRFTASELPPGYTADTLLEHGRVAVVDVPASKLGSASWNFGNAEVSAVLAAMDAAGTPVGEVLHIGEGMQTGHNTAFVLDLTDERAKELRAAGQVFPRARNSDIGRYELRDSGRNVLYTPAFGSLAAMPADLRAHLSSRRGELENRAAFKRGNCLWWQFTWPLHKDYFDRSRILCPYRATENRFAVDRDAAFLGLTDTTVLYDNDQPEDLDYIAAVLNSRISTARFRFIGKLLGGGVIEYYENTVSQLPLPRRAPGTPEHDELATLSSQRAALTVARRSTAIPTEQDLLDDQINTVEGDIERRVVKLFGLSDEQAEVLYAELPDGGAEA